MWTKGHEIKYWQKTGISKGDYIYDQYFKAFGLEKYDFSEKIVADVGCGPFGGVLSRIRCKEKISLDILANEYNKLSLTDTKLIYGDLSQRLPIHDEYCDAVICTNAIDHIPDVQHGFFELYRVLKKEGYLFLHVHLRTKKQLNKAHIHEINDTKVHQYISKSNFQIVNIFMDTDWVNDENDRMAAYLILKK